MRAYGQHSLIATGFLIFTLIPYENWSFYTHTSNKDTKRSDSLIFHASVNVFVQKMLKNSPKKLRIHFQITKLLKLLINSAISSQKGLVMISHTINFPINCLKFPKKRISQVNFLINFKFPRKNKLIKYDFY